MPRTRTKPKPGTRNSQAARLVPLLLAWFTASARDLPWRRTRDPYAIWASEIMLQQTQVKTVIPYWNRWMHELPTIEALAKAPSEKIHKLWEGLGYYTRVRNMQKAAQQIVAQQDALFLSRRRRGDEAQTKNKSETPHVVSYKFPENFDDILALPGVGRYTAGAISSIAFDQPTPILDGNVIRVLARVYGVATNPREKQTNAQLWQLAEELVIHASRITFHASPCSALNQSLMELGALVCTPRSPQCVICPLQKICIARGENLQEHLPNLGKRATATERRFLAFVVERYGKFLVRQRPAGVVNAHLWEFPNVEVAAVSRSRGRQSAQTFEEDNQRRLTSAATVIENVALTPMQHLCTIKHSITRYRITLEAWRAELPVGDDVRSLISKNQSETRHLVSYTSDSPPGRSSALQGRWLTLAGLGKLSFPSAHRKILAALADVR